MRGPDPSYCGVAVAVFAAAVGVKGSKSPVTRSNQTSLAHWLHGQSHRRVVERRMVRRVGEVLSLESDAVASPVRAAARTDEQAVEGRAGVEL